MFEPQLPLLWGELVYWQGLKTIPAPRGLAAGCRVPLVAVGRDCQAALLGTSARADLPFCGSCFKPSLYYLLSTWAWPSQGCRTLVPLTRLNPGPHPQVTSQPGHSPVPFAPQPAPDPGWGQWDSPVWDVLPCLLPAAPRTLMPRVAALLTSLIDTAAARSRTLVIHVWWTSALPCGEQSWDITGLRVSHPTSNIFWVSKTNHLVPQQLHF